MRVLFITLLVVLSTTSAFAAVVNQAVWKNDDRFSTSRDIVDLRVECYRIDSMKHREMRNLQYCNRGAVPLGIPVAQGQLYYSYKLHIFGKPNVQFTLNEGNSAHNIYFDNHEVSFQSQPDFDVCQRFTVSNLGDGYKDSRIIYIIQDQRRPKCNELEAWKKIEKNIANEEVKSSSVLPSKDEIATKAIEGLFWQVFKMVPLPIPGLDIIIKLFWPKFGPSAWDKLKIKVQKEISAADLSRVNTTTNQQLNTYRKKLEDLQEAMAENSIHVENLIMGISDMFVGKEELAMFENEVVLSSELLSVFTTTISLFINFHVWAIISADKFNLHADHIALLKRRRDRHVKQAHDYIMKVYDENMEHAYNTCDLTLNFYNCMVDVHNHIAMAGIRHLTIWRSVSEYKSNDSRTSDVLFYSRSFGTPTIELLKSAIFHPQGEFPRLTPGFSASTRKNITRIYVTYSDGQKRISNITVYYNETGNNYDSQEGDFFLLPENVYIRKIVVGGEGVINYVEFHRSDNVTEPFGFYDNDNNVPTATFEMEDHFIASVSVQNDNAQKLNQQNLQAKNIAVSYRQLNQFV